MTCMQCVWTCVYSVLSHSLILSSLPCVCVHNVVVCVECGLHGMYICSIYSVCVCTLDNLPLLLPNGSSLLTLLCSSFFSSPQFVSSLQEICLTENRRGLSSWHKLRLVIQKRSVWKDGPSFPSSVYTDLAPGLETWQRYLVPILPSGQNQTQSKRKNALGERKSASLRALLPQNSAESCHSLYRITGTVNPSNCREALGKHRG